MKDEKIKDSNKFLNKIFFYFLFFVVQASPKNSKNRRKHRRFWKKLEKIAKQIGKTNPGKQFGKNVGGIRRTQPAGLEPDPAPREAEVMEGSWKPLT